MVAYGKGFAGASQGLTQGPTARASQGFIQVKEFRLSINDMTGRALIDGEVKDITLRMEILDVSTLVPGTYILQLSTDDGFSQSETLIIE